MKILDVFDFDGTLFRSPCDTPENLSNYEKSTDTPWVINKELSLELTIKLQRPIPVRRGWWGRAETLEPPIVPDPAPIEWFIQETVTDLLKSKEDSNTITIIMTGRHAGLQRQVMRILSDGGLLKVKKTNSCDGRTFFDQVDPDVSLLCLGMNGPNSNAKDKPNETFPWKHWIIEQYCECFQIEKINIWEDRKEHIDKFRAMDLGCDVNVTTVVG